MTEKENKTCKCNFPATQTDKENYYCKKCKLDLE